MDFIRAYNMTDETEFQNCYHVHPLMQLELFHMINFLKPRGLTKLVVFGSSTTEFCHVWSDLDIYVEGCTRDVVEEYESKRRLEIDMVTPMFAGEGSPIRKQIDKYGVCVYG